MVALPVGEITDRVKSQDDSFQHVPSGVILNALSVVTVLEPAWVQATPSSSG